MGTLIARWGWTALQTIFAIKYGSRVIALPWLWAVGTPLFMWAGFRWMDRVDAGGASPKWLPWGYSGLMILLAGAVLVGIDPESLQVDRWSVVDSFWNTWFAGDYPYHAQSHLHNPPGPLPGYFLILFPFWVVNALATFSVLGGIGAIWRFPSAALAWGLTTSIFLLWETGTQSNLFTFTFLTLMYLDYISSNSKNLTLIKALLWGLLGGLLLNTRSILILAFIVYAPTLWRTTRSNPTVRWLGFAGMMAGFAAPLAILYSQFPEAFAATPPWLTQSTELLPPIYGFAFIALALLAGLIQVYHLPDAIKSGLVYALAMCAYAVHHTLENGWHQVFWDGGVDWSYFILATGFFVPYLKKDTMG